MSDLTDRLDALPDLVRMLRQARELSLRDAADEIGIPFNTLTRFERRMNDCQLSNVMAILRWVEGRDGVRPMSAGDRGGSGGNADAEQVEDQPDRPEGEEHRSNN